MKNGSENTSPISFLCPPELRKGIEEIAASEGISHSDVIRRAVMFDCRRRKQQAIVDAQRRDQIDRFPVGDLNSR